MRPVPYMKRKEENNNVGRCQRSGVRKGNAGERARRPMNCFLLWASRKRAALAVQHPLLHNTQISQLLGEIWNAMSAAEKRPYIDQAAHLKEQYLAAHPEARSRQVNRKYYIGSIPAMGNEGLKPVVMSPTFADDRRMSAEPIFASGNVRHTTSLYLHRGKQPEQHFTLDPEIATMVRVYLTGFVISDDEFDKYLRGAVVDDLMQPPRQICSYAPPSNAQRQRPQPSILQPRHKTTSSVTYIKMEPED